jgi:hypothetical protein
MPLSIGDKLGHYEVLSLLGKGGMGEVYRARDTTLKRDVALKVLPEAFARDPGRMARFQREAEVLASLNHPNIAHIHGIEERALVMELVEGESPKGPLPFEDAWKIVAYHSDESGRDEVYVRPFPAAAGGGGKWMVSQAGGRTPLWRGDGKELFCRSEEGDVMAAPVSARGMAFQPGTPTALFRSPTGSAGLAVSADGQKFLVTMPEFESRQIPITIVLNWMSLLKKQ